MSVSCPWNGRTHRDNSHVARTINFIIVVTVLITQAVNRNIVGVCWTRYWLESRILKRQTAIYITSCNKRFDGKLRQIKQFKSSILLMYIIASILALHCQWRTQLWAGGGGGGRWLYIIAILGTREGLNQ